MLKKETFMKTAIVTGANGSMGEQITIALAKQNFQVVMACKKSQEAIDLCKKIREKTCNPNVEVIHLDLASFNAVKTFVSDFASAYQRLDVLGNNAGVLCHHPEETEEKAEMSIGVNYLGHYLLTELLFPYMQSGSRIVNMVSLTYKYGNIDNDFFSLKKYPFNRFKFYSDSKLAFVHAALEWAEKWKEKGITVNCADPKIVNTNIIRMGNVFVDFAADIFYRPFIRKPAKGADTFIYLAIDEAVKDVTGTLFKDRTPQKWHAKATDIQKRSELLAQTKLFIEKYADVAEKLSL
jgi:NAD(P)-dependent dehydrogenase (short-subunit alcohol dehydrogenase family)